MPSTRFLFLTRFYADFRFIDARCPVFMRVFQESRGLYGWSPSGSWDVDVANDSEMPVEVSNLRSRRDLRGTPIHTTWVPIKSI